MKPCYLIFAALLATGNFARAQVNIGASTPPDASAVLELSSTNKGLLLPRIALTATNSSGPVTAPATGLIIYNTATAGTAPFSVIPGIYSWDGTVWIRVDNQKARTAMLMPVLTNTLTAAPASPNEGDAYLVPAAATGIWLGNSNKIASWDKALSTWNYYSPVNTDQVAITTGTNAGKIYVYNGTQWTEKPGGGLGFMPASSATTITINGVSFDLTTNRSWTIATGSSTLAGLTDVAITTPAAGNMLQYNSVSGKWVNTASPGFWRTSGNAGTTPGTDFIGTTDNADLVFKRGNQVVGKLSLGSLSFGLGAMTNTSGNNTAYGTGALFSAASGAEYNVGVGHNSLQDNSTGFGNTATGAFSLTNNTTGNHNTAFGYNVLSGTTTAQSNTGVGSGALQFTLTGTKNVAVGMSALSGNTHGSDNTAVGNNALLGALIGNNNVAVGSNAYVSGGTYSNSMALGSNTVITGSNLVRVGDVSVTSIGGYQGWTNISDARFKKDVQYSTVPGLSFIMKLRPATYYLDLVQLEKHTDPEGKLTNRASSKEAAAILHTGFLAQDVERTAKELGFDFSGIDKPKSEKDMYGLRYAEFTVPLVKAVQEQQALIEKLTRELAEYKLRLEALEKK